MQGFLYGQGTVYVEGTSLGNLQMVNAITGRLTGNVTGIPGGSGWGISDPTTNSLYLSSVQSPNGSPYTDLNITAVSTASNQVVHTYTIRYPGWAGGNWIPAIDPSSNLLYFALGPNYDANVTILNLSTGSVAHVDLWVNGHEHIDSLTFDPTNGDVIATEGGCFDNSTGQYGCQSNVTAIDGQNGSIVRSLSWAPPFPSGFTFSSGVFDAQDQRLYLPASNGSSSLAVVNSSTLNVTGWLYPPGSSGCGTHLADSPS